MWSGGSNSGLHAKQVLYWLRYHPSPLGAYFKKRYLILNLSVCVYVCICVYICVYLCVDMCVKWMHVPAEFRRGRQTPWVRLWVDVGNRGCQVLCMLLANCWAHSSVPSYIFTCLYLMSSYRATICFAHSRRSLSIFLRCYQLSCVWCFLLIWIL